MYSTAQFPPTVDLYFLHCSDLFYALRYLLVLVARNKLFCTSANSQKKVLSDFAEHLHPPSLLKISRSARTPPIALANYSPPHSPIPQPPPPPSHLRILSHQLSPFQSPSSPKPSFHTHYSTPQIELCLTEAVPQPPASGKICSHPRQNGLARLLVLRRSLRLVSLRRHGAYRTPDSPDERLSLRLLFPRSVCERLKPLNTTPNQTLQYGFHLPLHEPRRQR